MEGLDGSAVLLFCTAETWGDNPGQLTSESPAPLHLGRGSLWKCKRCMARYISTLICGFKCHFSGVNAVHIYSRQHWQVSKQFQPLWTQCGGSNSSCRDLLNGQFCMSYLSSARLVLHVVSGPDLGTDVFQVRRGRVDGPQGSRSAGRSRLLFRSRLLGDGGLGDDPATLGGSGIAVSRHRRRGAGDRPRTGCRDANHFQPLK